MSQLRVGLVAEFVQLKGHVVEFVARGSFQQAVLLLVFFGQFSQTARNLPCSNSGFFMSLFGFLRQGLRVLKTCSEFKLNNTQQDRI
jgi:hypothetical protein